MLALGDQKRVRDGGGDMDDVARAQRMPRAAIEPRSHKLPGAAGGFLVNQRATQLKGSLSALDEDDVDDVVVLFGKPVGVTVQEAEAVIAKVGQRFA